MYLLDSETYQLTDYVFRGMSAREIKVSNGKKNLFDKEQYILTRCVVNEVDWENALAGMSSTLLSLIYHYSGTDEAALTIKKAIEWTQREEGVLEGLAVVTIPGLTFEILDNCDPAHYAKYLVLGKEMFEILYQGRVQEPQQPQSNQANPMAPWAPGKVQTTTQLPTKPGEIGQSTESFNWHR